MSSSALAHPLVIKYLSLYCSDPIRTNKTYPGDITQEKKTVQVGNAMESKAIMSLNNTNTRHGAQY